MTLLDFIPLGVVLALGVSTLIQRHASHAVQKTRLVLAVKGEQFLARKNVPDDLRQDVRRLLDSAFSCGCWFMFIIIPFLPILVWTDLVRGKTDERFEQLQHADKEVRGAYFELRSLHRKITLANHPLVSPVGELIISLSLVVAVPILLIAHRFNESTLDRDSAAAGVDEYWSHLPARIRAS